MKILGIGHYSRTGKDSFADFLVEEIERKGRRKAKKLPLAWKLKHICYDLFKWAGHREPEFYDTPEGAPLRDIKLSMGMTPVELWVSMGTPAIREKVYDRTWIDFILKNDHDCDVLIVPDVRFFNEVEAFRKEGAMLVKAIRPGVGPRSTVADMALSSFWGWDMLIGGGGLDELRKNAREIAPWCCDVDDFPTQSRDEFIRMQHMEGQPK